MIDRNTEYKMHQMPCYYIKLPVKFTKAKNKMSKLMKAFTYLRLSQLWCGRFANEHMKLNINKLLSLWTTVIYKDQYGSIIHWLSHELL